MKEQCVHHFGIEPRHVDKTEEAAHRLAQWIIANPDGDLSLHFPTAKDAKRLMKRVAEILDPIVPKQENGPESEALSR